MRIGCSWSSRSCIWPVVMVAGIHSPAEAAPLDVVRSLVAVKTWTEQSPDRSGVVRSREVTAEIWTAAFQRRIDEAKRLEIPARAEPYYVDGPLILPSGGTIVADAAAEIRLVPGVNTCLVRNANLVGFAAGPVPGDCRPDTDILIEGGIWTTTLATTANAPRGNANGRSASAQPVPGTHGVILLHNVRGVRIHNVTVRESRPFAVHLGNVRDFVVDGLTLEHHFRDGVHVSGPAADGLIRNVRGVSKDDPVALTAWDWRQYAPSFGPIERIVIEDITGSPPDASANNAVRLLPGVKRFVDGTLLECPIRDITLRRITDITEFKCYDQPNLEVPAGADASERIGRLENIRFEQLSFQRPGTIEIHADTDGLVIDGVTLDFDPHPAWHLLTIGPKSMTYKGKQDNPAKWREIFSPDRDCTVRDVSISGVRRAGEVEDLPLDRLVKVIELEPNPDYPKTTPKGGTGKGIWLQTGAAAAQAIFFNNGPHSARCTPENATDEPPFCRGFR
jgi:hypothetical protein